VRTSPFEHLRAVARRCVPTGIDLEGQFEEVFNFTSPKEFLESADSDTTSNISSADLILNLDLQSIIDGTA
jgi:hypothetical protein